MSKICYTPKKFSKKSEAMIVCADAIIKEYQAQGYTLTLRQLYYQFVSRDLLPNSQRSYKNLGGVINDARLAGYIDWEAIEDRTRFIRETSTWQDEADIIKAVAQQFTIDLWEGQKNHVEVWIEKDALVGVIENVCRRWQVPYIACRGYLSQSELWRSSIRMRNLRKHEGRNCVVLHFGDHDPSGIDMTRDIGDRFRIFGEHDVEIRRLALNMDQVEEYNPPPNPAKTTDSRFEDYQREHGDESWELDALEPKLIEGLIEEELKELVDPVLFNERQDEQERGRERLTVLSERFDTAMMAIEE